MNYPFDRIVINGRQVSLADILSKKAKAQTDFEKSTFEFLTEWISGKQTFTFQTSGSTGDPKPITFSRDQIRKSAQRTARTLNMQTGDVVLVCLNTNYVAGKMMLVRAFESGLHIVATEPSSNPFEKINSSVDYVSLVPLQVQQILSEPHGIKTLNSLKGILVGGGATSALLESKIQSLKCPVFATYGMTETISNIALKRLSAKAESNFVALPGVTVSLDGRDCLVIDDTLTNVHVITNDLAKIHSPTSFDILGRADNVINTGGVKVFPEKIEAKLERLFSSNDIPNSFLVSSVSDDRLGQRVILLIEGNLNKSPTELKNRMADVLDRFELPSEVHFLDQFIYTPTGKPNRALTTQLITKSRG